MTVPTPTVAAETAPAAAAQAATAPIDPVATVLGQVNEIGRGALELLPNLLTAVVILFVTWIVAKFATGIADRLTDRTHMRSSLQNLIETIVRLGIWIFGILIALVILMPGFTPSSLIAGLGIGAVAIGFAFQDIFENFMAGILIMLRRKMRIGDVIECQGISGRVEHISLRETHVRKLSNEVTIVPNAMLFKNPVEIFTDDDVRRHEVIVGVSYDTDLDDAAKVIRKAVEQAEGVNGDRRIDVFAREFNSSSVDFTVRWWAGSKPLDMHQTRDAVIRGVKCALDNAGIEIPFPYMTHTFKEALSIARADPPDEKASATEPANR